MKALLVPYPPDWTSDLYSEDDNDDTITATTIGVDAFVPVKTVVLLVQCILIPLVYHHDPPNHHRQPYQRETLLVI